MQRRTGVTRELVGQAEQSVEVVCTHGENGGGPVGEENGRIRCERCEIKRKAKNGMDGMKRVLNERGMCVEQGRMIFFFFLFFPH